MTIHCPNCSVIIEASPSARLPIRDRLDMQIVKESPPDDLDVQGDCWIWMSSAAGGYGQIYIEGKALKTHRVMYELEVGPIPEGLHLDHLCRRTRCCNPAHLEAVTPQVNVLRSTGPAAKNALKTHCKRGHEFTEENTLPRGKTGRKCRACHYAEIEGRRRAAGMKKRQPGDPGRPHTYTPPPTIIMS